MKSATKPQAWTLSPQMTAAPELWRNIHGVIPFWRSESLFVIKDDGNRFSDEDVSSASWSWTTTQNGIALRTNDTDGLVVHNEVDAPHSGPFAGIVVVDNSDLADSSNALMADMNSSSNIGWSLKLEQFGSPGQLGFTKHGVADLTSTFDSPTGFAVIGFTVEANDNVLLFLDGKKDDLQNSQSFSEPSDSDKAWVLAETKQTDFAQTDFLFAALWNRELTDSEHKCLADDPFAMLRPAGF
jgi:hypothetical protein